MREERFDLRARIASPLVAVMGALLAGLLSTPTASASTAANEKSPLGINLNGVTYYTAEQPFLNIFKTTGVTQSNPAWVTGGTNVYDTKEEAYLQLDANGYPTTLAASSSDPNKPQLFNHVSVNLLAGLSGSNGGSGPPYRAGQYVVLYDGQGTIAYTVDAKLVSHSAGRDVIQVAQPNGGIGINIVATDPNHTGNYIRNIRVVYASEEALLNSGAVFRPAFVSSLANFRVLRFMDWLNTNNSTLTSWSQRPQLTDAGWGGSNGVPLEVAIDLANAVGADPWLNVPAEADDNYITQMATLVHNMLGPDQKVYVEFSNEVWNGQFQQNQYATAKGQALAAAVPAALLTGGTFQYNRDWYGMRTAQVCDIWKSVWGTDYSRVHCVLAAQAPNPWTAVEALNCPLWTGAGNAPCYKHNITDVAIAPYFGFQAPVSWSQLDLSAQLNDLFTELNQGGLVAGDYPGGPLKEVSDWEAAYTKALAPFGLPLISYEGGQTFVAAPTYPNGSWAQKLYVAANADPRMAAAYARALSDWRANGGTLYMQFVDVSAPSQWGEWGALGSFLDTISPLSSAPPKWQALQNFISSNPCWWANCDGTVAAVPDAPGNFSAVK
jgi:hypothetical protein